ncbi:hypothetical protein Ocin01_10475 [Orchesella cincta]|uniref:Uncharacterized protein n=1 Tax=Orchesella cincta TaxID=48709 RepID=A0A1D2MU30_ORCCI|nr:hypothetical protein Ocin01_10475 [Orchesella cincta]
MTRYDLKIRGRRQTTMATSSALGVNYGVNMAVLGEKNDFIACGSRLPFLIAVPVEHVEGVLKSQVKLPCNVSVPTRDDKLHMVLWFRDRDGEPIYSTSIILN